MNYMKNLFKRNKVKNNNKDGFITFTMVIIISAIALVTASAIILTATDSVSNATQLEQSKQAKALSDTCTENAINKLKQNNAYAGNETINLANGSCQILSISGSGNSNRNISTIGTMGVTIKKVNVIITTLNPFVLQSWQETQ